MAKLQLGKVVLSSDVERLRGVLAENEERIRKLEERLKDLQSVFDLQFRRMGEATKLWQRAHPDKKHVHPDLGDMLHWFCLEVGGKAKRSRANLL